MSIVASAVVGGCGNGFDPSSYVSSLRLIDVKAEPAELPGGATTTMTATWANPGKAAPAIAWDYCALPPAPGSGSGINENCIQPDMSAPYLIPIGSGDSVTFTLPTLTLAQLGTPDATDGFYLPVRLRLRDDKQSVTAFFNLRYYPGPITPNPPNNNPKLMGLFRVPSPDAGATEQMEIVDGMPVDVHKSDVIDLRALLTADSAESYLILTGDPTKGTPMTRHVTETVSVSWLATAGQFSNQVTGAAKPNTTWTLDKNLPSVGSLIDLWLVARDERGGSDVMHRTFNFK